LPDPILGLLHLFQISKKYLYFSEARKSWFLKKIGLQKPCPGNVEYRFTRKEIRNLFEDEAVSISIKTAFIQNIPFLQNIFKKLDGRVPYPIFLTLFYLVNGVFGRFGNAFMAKIIKNPCYS